MRFSQRLDGATNARLVALAKARGRSKAEEIRVAIAKHLDPGEALSDGQRRALHTLCGKVDRLNALPRRSTHAEALAAAGRQFGRTFGSVDDLSGEQASWTLDWLEEQLTGTVAGLEA